MEDVDRHKLEDIFKTRQWFYDFLGKSFYLEPRKSRLEDEFLLKIFEELKRDNEDIENPGARLMDKALREINRMTDKEFLLIKEDYNRLFVGPGPLLAPPWESVYLSEEKIIFNKYTLLVRDFYKTWGLSINREEKEPDDHIGFQLEFMSILSEKAAKAIKENNIEGLKSIIDAQNQFLENHTFRWSDKFFNALYKSCEENLFKALAIFTSEYLEMDKRLLEDLIKDIC